MKLKINDYVLLKKSCAEFRTGEIVNDVTGRYYLFVTFNINKEKLEWNFSQREKGSKCLNSAFKLSAGKLFRVL